MMVDSMVNNHPFAENDPRFGVRHTLPPCGALPWTSLASAIGELVSQGHSPACLRSIGWSTACDEAMEVPSHEVSLAPKTNLQKPWLHGGISALEGVGRG